MFGSWLRKRRYSAKQESGAISELLQRPTEYASFVVDLIHAADNSTRAMCVVAIENLRPMLLVLQDTATLRGKSFDLDATIVKFCNRMETDGGDDPINARRQLWFVMGLHVTKLDALAAQRADLIDSAAKVWLELAAASKYIPRLLEANVVWKDEEKIWFETTKSERDGITYAMTQAMPRAYRHTATVRAFADHYDIFLI